MPHQSKDIWAIRGLFEKAGLTDNTPVETLQYSKADLYELGLSGKDDSSVKRDTICKENDLPCGMSPNAFLAAINLLGIRLDNKE